MGKKITSETADLIYKALVFQGVASLVNAGLSDETIEAMDKEIMKHAERMFLDFLEEEGIDGIIEEVHIIDGE